MDKNASSSSKAREAVSQNIQMVALEFAKAYRAFELYPLGHPQLKSMINMSYQKILPEIKKLGEISFTVSRDTLLFEGKRLENLPALNQLASELHIRQIRKFAFRQNMDLREFMALLELLLAPAEEFRSGNKIENYFREKKIRSIWINEVDFGKVFFGQGTAEKADEDSSEKELKADELQNLSLLIDALDSAHDDTQAQEALEKIEKQIEQMAGKDKFAQQWYLLGAVSDFLDQKGKIFPLSAEKSLAILKRFAEQKFLAWLVNNFIYTGEATGKAFHRYFDQVGEPALKAMLERLMTPESVYFQKEIISYLRQRGKTLRANVESILMSQKSAANLKLVYLLGEFRLQESAPLILELANQKDPFLKREAIRALGKIKGKKASLGLTAMLRDKKMDSETRALLIQTLAEMQETIAVPGLISILLNRYEDSDVREKAGEALGRIGSREALPALVKILKKPLLFRKPAPENVRLKCAEALARIGGERAEAMLMELSEQEGKLAKYSRDLLKQMLDEKGKKR